MSDTRKDPYEPTDRAVAAAAKPETLVALRKHVDGLDSVTVRAGVEALRRVLRGLRSHDQGGYPLLMDEPDAEGSRWAFVSTGLPSVARSDLDSLFALAGIEPDQIGHGEPQKVGHCSTCGNAKGEGAARRERGYEGPCLYCRRPLMSHWVPLGRLSKRKDGKPWLERERW